jgi:hypothetical protein
MLEGTVYRFIHHLAARLRDRARHTMSGRPPHLAAMSPTFIVGCGHSGTSILLRIIGAHSRIHAIAEESSLATSKDPQLILRQFDTEAKRHGKPRWIEKTPSHIHHVQTLLSLRDDVRILLIIRDGRDVAWSIKERENDLQKGIERWINDNRAGEPFWTHPQVKVLRYEELVSSPETVITDILAFLGEAFEPNLLHYHREPRNFYSSTIKEPPGRAAACHRQFRNWQINQPLFDGRERWRQLTEPEKVLIKQRMGEMLTRYGYGREPDW